MVEYTSDNDDWDDASTDLKVAAEMVAEDVVTGALSDTLAVVHLERYISCKERMGQANDALLARIQAAATRRTAK